jgi:transposase-like protein
MTTTTGRAVDAGAVKALRLSYDSLVRAGHDSVRSAWRFGQTIDSFSDAYTMKELAETVGLSAGTLYRYHRLFAAYQRPELAIAASEQLETYNIEHARPRAGRRFRYRCHHCKSTDVGREEITGAN